MIACWFVYVKAGKSGCREKSTGVEISVEKKRLIIKPESIYSHITEEWFTFF